MFALLFALFFGDEIYGYWHWQHLCKTEGGLHVYKRVPVEGFRENGQKDLLGGISVKAIVLSRALITEITPTKLVVYIAIRITPHPLYLAIDRNDADRQMVYRALFRCELDEEALSDIRLALSQGSRLVMAVLATRYARRQAFGVPRSDRDDQRVSLISPVSLDTQTGFGF